MNYVIAIAGTYIVTLVIAKGSIFNRQRQWLIDHTPWLQKQAMRGEAIPAHYLVCRLCLTALVAGIFCFIYQVNWFVVYGAGYFLATQER